MFRWFWQQQQRGPYRTCHAGRRREGGDHSIRRQCFSGATATNSPGLWTGRQQPASPGQHQQLCQRLEEIVVAATQGRAPHPRESRRRRLTSRRACGENTRSPSPFGVATSGQGLDDSRMFYMSDRVTNNRYLINTGAGISAIPATHTDRSLTPIYFLLALNYSTIPVYRERSITLNLGLRLVFRWKFPGGRCQSGNSRRGLSQPLQAPRGC